VSSQPFLPPPPPLLPSTQSHRAVVRRAFLELGSLKCVVIPTPSSLRDGQVHQTPPFSSHPAAGPAERPNTLPCGGLHPPWQHTPKGGVGPRRRLQGLSTEREEQGYIKFYGPEQRTSNILKKTNTGMKSATRMLQGQFGVLQQFGG